MSNRRLSDGFSQHLRLLREQNLLTNLRILNQCIFIFEQAHNRLAQIIWLLLSV